MKTLIRIICLFVLTFTTCTVLSSCHLLLDIADENRHALYMGFDKSDYTVVKEEDTHGGFHGDGDYYLVVDCSSDPEKARENISDWTPLPFPKNTDLFLYGEEGPGYSIGGCLDEEIMPRVQNGYYKFIDKNNKTDPSNESALLNAFSYNFQLAVYDLDTDTLYYYELDT